MIIPFDMIGGNDGWVYNPPYLGDWHLAMELTFYPKAHEYLLVNNSAQATAEVYEEDLGELRFNFTNNTVVLNPPGGQGNRMAEASKELTSQLFPNPVSDVATLSGTWEASSDLSISLMNLQGQKQLLTQISRQLGAGEAQDFSYKLDARNLAPGMYFVLVEGEGIPTQSIKIHKR
ncbi:MAG: T9SS type A sorting domain-containing protein [Bacteroidota bacterium]